MATSTKRKSYRRRASSHRSTRRRRPRTNGHRHFVRRHRTRTNWAPRRRRRSMRRNPVVVYRYCKGRKVSHRRRHNPGSRGEGIKSIVINAGWAGVGAIGSRAATQFLAGSYNTGFTGYGLNAVAGALIAWGVGKFFGKSARNYALVGTALGIGLRMLQDLTPWGSKLALSGFGDSGMGALVPMSFVQPALRNPDGSTRVPAGFRQVVTVGKGIGATTGSAYGRGRSAYVRA